MANTSPREGARSAWRGFRGGVRRAAGRGLAGVLIALLVAACTGGSTPPVDPAARGAYEEGVHFERASRAEEAAEAYSRALHHDPRHLDAWAGIARLDTDTGSSTVDALLRDMEFPPGDPRGEALASVRGAVREYLAVVEAPGALRVERAEAFTRAHPDRHFGWRALAAALLDADDADDADDPGSSAASADTDVLEAAERAAELAPEDPDVLDVLARARFHSGDWTGTIAAAREAASRDPGQIWSQVYLSVRELSSRRYRQAALRLDDLALRRPDRPLSDEQRLVWWMAYDRTLTRLAAERDDALGLDLARRAAERFRTATVEVHRAWFAHRMGEPEEAAAAIARALGADPYDPDAVELARRLAFADGRYEEGLALWARTVPTDLVLSDENELAPRFREVYAAAAAGDRARLGRACLAVGWLEEARTLTGEDPPVRTFLDRLARHVHRHYVAIEADRSTPDIFDFADEIDRLWGPNPPFRTRDDLETHHLIVTENDPITPPAGSLGEHLARHGYFFDLVDAQGYVDLRLMRAVVRRRSVEEVEGGRLEHTVLIGDRTPIPAYDEFTWGDLRRAGRAFMSREGYYVSADALHSSPASLRRLAAIANGGDPRGAGVWSEKGGSYDTEAAALMARRAFAPFLAEGDPDDWSEETLGAFQQYVLAARVDATIQHELGHRIDFEDYIPLAWHLGTNLWTALSHGFDPSAIRDRFERLAEVYALARTPHTSLVLLDNLRRLAIDRRSLSYLLRVAFTGERPEESPYYRGAERFFEELAEMADDVRGVNGIDAETSPPGILARLPEEEVRRLAAELAEDGGIP